MTVAHVMQNTSQHRLITLHSESYHSSMCQRKQQLCILREQPRLAGDSVATRQVTVSFDTYNGIALPPTIL